MARPRVLIIGGGFGGLSAARALKRAAVDVTVVDRLNHHLFQPLLYQVATGILSDGQIAPPLRWVFRGQKNVRVHLAEVVGFDLKGRTGLRGSSRRRRADARLRLPDRRGGLHPHLLRSRRVGRVRARTESLTDAHRLRAQILGAFELAAEADDAAERERWLTFVTVGAGPTGVELTGQITELARRLLAREYRTIHASKARIVLLDAGRTCSPPSPRSSSVGPTTTSSRWARRSAPTPRSPRSTQMGLTSRAPVARRVASRPRQWSGLPAWPPRRWRGCSQRQVVPKPTTPAGSRSTPTALCRATLRCSRSAT